MATLLRLPRVGSCAGASWPSGTNSWTIAAIRVMTKTLTVHSSHNHNRNLGRAFRRRDLLIHWWVGLEPLLRYSTRMNEPPAGDEEAVAIPANEPKRTRSGETMRRPQSLFLRRWEPVAFEFYRASTTNKTFSRWRNSSRQAFTGLPLRRAVFRDATGEPLLLLAATFLRIRSAWPGIRRS